jgi:hypothetical protein
MFVAHGVHMIFDGLRGKKWETGNPGIKGEKGNPGITGITGISKLVLIGMRLDEINPSLEEGFRACRHV